MKKAIVGVLVVVLLTSGLLAGCGEVTVTGSGNLKTETFNFSNFNKVEAESGFQVELIKSSTFSVEITADDNVLKYIKVDKSGDTLRIRPKGNRIYRSVTMRAKITMPDLYKIELSGGSRANITGFSSSQDFSVGLSGGSGVAGDIITGDADFDLSGGSQVNLEGTADDLRVKGSGGSHLSLESFPVNNADIHLSGGGSATVNVNGTLDVNLSGGSHVIYIGEPTLGDIDLSGDSTVTASAEKVFDARLASQLQAVLDDAVDSPETVFPGALLHVSSPDLGTWSGAAGLGNIETDTAMRADDMFPVCSIVKVFVSVVTLQLVEEGLFALDDTLPALLPENVTARFANSNRITVRMLLNHTSGHGNWEDTIIVEALTNPHKVWGTDEILDLSVAQQDPNFALGESWRYSNTGYFLLHLIIEQATGRSYREEIRERIINKLNMENTAMPEPGDPSYPGNYFHSYFFYGGEVYDLSEIDASIARALVSTAADLTRFLDAVMSGELFQNSETLDEMLTSLVEPPEGTVPFREAAGYGLGMMKFVFPGGIEMFGHLGDNPDSTFVYHLPAQDITISGAANSMDPLSLYYQILIPALEILVPGFEPVSQQIPPASTPPITDADGNVIPGSITSLETVNLGGVEQWILIRGKDTTKPVLLWLHGGPGMAYMPWVGLFQTAELEANFVVVQWDQRGAGKSFSKDLTAEDMRVEKFVSDTLELTDILRERFNQEKIFLFGHSWGSALGFMTIMENSEPYYAYIAAAEAADWSRRQTMSYEWVLEQAREDNNTEVIQVLESIQPFDPTNLEHVAAKNQFLDIYRGGDLYTEGLWDTYLDYALSGKSPEYTSADVENYMVARAFSHQTVVPQAVDYNLFRDFPVSPIPVHFFAGRHDHQTPGELAEEYYNFLEAPAKSFTWFENSCHTMIWDEPDKTTQELIRIANETLNP